LVRTSDENGKKEWLCRENLLIKRAVIDFNGTIVVGFNEDTIKGYSYE
jgi:arsenate reductase-like glutaredoxin family protein